MKIGMKQYESETRAKMNKSENNITTTITNSNGDVTLATEQQPSDQNHTDMNNNNGRVSNGIIHTQHIYLIENCFLFCFNLKVCLFVNRGEVFKYYKFRNIILIQ